MELHLTHCVNCLSVAQLQEAKSKVEEEKTAVEEDKVMQLLLNKAEVSTLTSY